MKNVSIVMATYNGMRFLKEQIESIYKQTIPAYQLIICDDLSTDGTKEYLCDLKIKYSNIKLNFNSEQLGPMLNFENGMKLASGDYIAFSDQDDVWLPNKLELLVKKMEKMEKEYGDNKPLLVYSDLTVVDRDLNIVHQSFMKNQGLYNINDKKKQLPTLLVQNYVTGCTMLINKTLKMHAIPFPNAAIMHDYWITLIAASIGYIGYVDQPTILYRQHGDNTVGAKAYFSISNLCKLLKCSQMIEQIDFTIKQVLELSTYKQGEIADKNPIINQYLSAVNSGNLMELLLINVKKEGVIRNLFFKLFLVIYSMKNK